MPSLQNTLKHGRVAVETSPRSTDQLDQYRESSLALVINHTGPLFLCTCVSVCEGAGVLSGTSAVAQSVGHPVDWRDFPEHL